MPSFSECKISSVRLSDGVLDIGAAASKAIPSHARYRYVQQVTYLLEDGREVPGSWRAMSKPKLKEQCERNLAGIARGAWSATFHDGEFLGTSQRYVIGVGGLEPAA